MRSRDDVVFRLAELPDGVDGVCWSRGDMTAVVLDERLTRTQRNAALAHELVHVERGITGDERTDERGVEDEVARRLVPFEDLAAMYEIAVLNELPVEVWQAAEHFDVPDTVAERAMRLLLRGDCW